MIYKNYKLKKLQKKKKRTGRVCGSTALVISKIRVAQPTPKIHFRSSSSKLYLYHCSCSQLCSIRPWLWCFLICCSLLSVLPSNPTNGSAIVRTKLPHWRRAYIGSLRFSSIRFLKKPSTGQTTIKACQESKTQYRLVLTRASGSPTIEFKDTLFLLYYWEILAKMRAPLHLAKGVTRPPFPSSNFFFFFFFILLKI